MTKNGLRVECYKTKTENKTRAAKICHPEWRNKDKTRRDKRGDRRKLAEYQVRHLTMNRAFHRRAVRFTATVCELVYHVIVDVLTIDQVVEKTICCCIQNRCLRQEGQRYLSEIIFRKQSVSQFSID